MKKIQGKSTLLRVSARFRVSKGWSYQELTVAKIPYLTVTFFISVPECTVNNTYYYSFKIFPRFWLAKSTRLIHHNQLLMTKFGRNLTLTRKWRQKCSFSQVKAPLTEKTWGRGWVVLVVNLKKWRIFHSFQE